MGNCKNHEQKTILLCIKQMMYRKFHYIYIVNMERSILMI